ncbi:hypothetical protein HK639_32 [Escherichia phage HK639]|uniref:hypothetical protein n=3 Tax=root TaxID=1 RepID=UPI00022FB476|nr:hypothetical protein HK639_32 [Escherichia phage HK639]ADO67716.1 unknown [Escherichia phage HK639]
MVRRSPRRALQNPSRYPRSNPLHPQRPHLHRQHGPLSARIRTADQSTGRADRRRNRNSRTPEEAACPARGMRRTMSTIHDIRNQLSTLVTEAHKVACALDIGDERTEAFELYEALRRLQRQGAAGEVLSATNPLLASPYYDEDWEEDEDD